LVFSSPDLFTLLCPPLIFTRFRFFFRFFSCPFCKLKPPQALSGVLHFPWLYGNPPLHIFPCYLMVFASVPFAPPRVCIKRAVDMEHTLVRCFLLSVSCPFLSFLSHPPQNTSTDAPLSPLAVLAPTFVRVSSLPPRLVFFEQSFKFHPPHHPPQLEFASIGCF